MSSKINHIQRRKFLKQAANGAAAVTTASLLPNLALGANKKLTVGMNIPMTGDYAPWGLPGLYGCEIIVKNINAAGGVTIGGDTYDINVASYDHGYETEKAIQGFKKLVLEDDAKMVYDARWIYRCFRSSVGHAEESVDHDFATQRHHT